MDPKTNSPTPAPSLPQDLSPLLDDLSTLTTEEVIDVVRAMRNASDIAHRIRTKMMARIAKMQHQLRAENAELKAEIERLKAPSTAVSFEHLGRSPQDLQAMREFFSQAPGLRAGLEQAVIQIKAEEAE